MLHRTGAEPEELIRPPQGAGYSHELVEVSECLREGRTESSVMPLADTLAVQRILNDASERLGVFHRRTPTSRSEPARSSERSGPSAGRRVRW